MTDGQYFFYGMLALMAVFGVLWAAFAYVERRLEKYDEERRQIKEFLDRYDQDNL